MLLYCYYFVKTQSFIHASLCKLLSAFQRSNSELKSFKPNNFYPPLEQSSSSSKVFIGCYIRNQVVNMNDWIKYRYEAFP